MQACTTRDTQTQTQKRKQKNKTQHTSTSTKHTHPNTNTNTYTNTHTHKHTHTHNTQPQKLNREMLSQCCAPPFNVVFAKQFFLETEWPLPSSRKRLGCACMFFSCQAGHPQDIPLRKTFANSIQLYMSNMAPLFLSTSWQRLDTEGISLSFEATG
jgi:hypothetical protein